MRSILRLLLLVVLLGTAGWFSARWAAGSAWGRDVVERRIGRLLEMDVRATNVRLEWPGVVVAEGLVGRISGASSAEPEFKAREIRVHLRGRRHIEVQRPWVRLVQSSAGDWQPAILRGFARAQGSDLPLEVVLDQIAATWPARGDYTVSGAVVLCVTGANEKPVFGGLSWTARRVALEGVGPDAVQHRVSLQTRDGKPANEDGFLTTEWLSVPGRPPLRLWGAAAEAVEKTAPPAVAPKPELPPAMPPATPPAEVTPPPPPPAAPDAAPPVEAPKPTI